VARDERSEEGEPEAGRPPALRPSELLFATAVVAGAALVASQLHWLLPVASLALVFVCGVLLVAVRTRTSVALYAALASSLAYIFLFTEPRFTLRIASPNDVAAVATFVLAALVVGQLAGRQRAQVVALERAAEQAGERARLLASLEAARVESETERLRNALLSSVSHDLRSPLASVIGAASSLAAYGDSMSADDRRELLESIRTEGERLDRYIQNLLDMTRLGSGPLELQRDWYALDEILAAASGRLHQSYPATEVIHRLEPNLPLLSVHAALVEQAIFNVLENAAEFSPPNAPIVVTARRAGDALELDITDRGPGIPEEERRRIFEKFFSVARGDRGRRGTGLGLTIVRGMIGAHGGFVSASAGEDGVGTTIRLRLPLLEAPPTLGEDET
jgi:K+-sensing histidine kinase KdpD